MSIIILLFSLVLGLIINIFIMKLISVIDYQLLGLNRRKNSIFYTYSCVFKNKQLFNRILVLQILFIILNYIILYKIFKTFNFQMIYNYLRYYYLFLVLYIFAFVDYITCYVYTILSYPLIIFSLIIFILSFLHRGTLSGNIETILTIGLFYLVIKKFKFLGEGDFDILLIVSLTLGAIPTIFIFYLSVIISIIIGIYIVFTNSFKTIDSKMTFIPFVFLSTFLLIISSI